MNTIQRIAKNTTLMFSSQVISYILLFFATIYTARYLGTEGFGILSLALAITGIYAIFADLGLNTFIVREVSKNTSISDKYLTNTFLMKIILALITFFITYLTVTIVNYSQEVSLAIYIILISMIFSSFTGILNSIFQAHEKMEYQSLSNILNGIIMFGIVLFAIYNNLGLLSFAIIYLISSIIILIYSFIVYLLKFHISKFEVDLKFWKPTITEAWPFGISGLFAMVFVWIDSFLLSIIIGNDSVGIYNAAYRLIMFLLFIPTILNMVMFPLMSKFFVSSENSLKKILRKYFKLMLIIAIPIGISTMILSDKIILLIFGSNYTGSIIALQILIWATVFIFLNSAYIQLLQSTNQQRSLMKIATVGMVVNILLNILLIPKFSYIGASAVTVLTEFIILVLVFYKVNYMGYDILIQELNDIIKVVFTSIVIGIFILNFKYLSLPLIIFIVTLLYFGILYLINGIEKEDIKLIKKIVGK